MISISDKTDEQKQIITPKQIQIEKWDNRGKSDTDNFIDCVSTYADNLGIKGDKLFDLTLDNNSSSICTRKVSLGIGGSASKGMFHSFCPELETYVTLTNWLGDSSTRKKERLQYHKILREFNESKEENKVCKIDGNYRIKKGDFSNILIYLSKIEIKDKKKNFLDWPKAPFLKRSGETLNYFPSPVFMSSVKSELQNVAEERIYCFSAIFKFVSLKNNLMTIKILNCTNPYYKDIEVLAEDKELIEKLKDISCSTFIGLFEDKIYRKNSYQREFVLHMAEKASGDMIVAHLLTQRMYYNYLMEGNLYICSNSKLRNRYESLCRRVFEEYNEELELPFDLFCKFYFGDYFVNINDNWFYRPYVLQKLDSQTFDEFLNFLSECQDNTDEDITKLIALRQKKDKFQKYKLYLEFINNYNYYSKRTLIEIINNERWNYKWKF